MPEMTCKMPYDLDGFLERNIRRFYQVDTVIIKDSGGVSPKESLPWSMNYAKPNAQDYY